MTAPAPQIHHHGGDGPRRFLDRRPPSCERFEAAGIATSDRWETIDGARSCEAERATDHSGSGAIQRPPTLGARPIMPFDRARGRATDVPFMGTQIAAGSLTRPALHAVSCKPKVDRTAAGLDVAQGERAVNRSIGDPHSYAPAHVAVE